MLIYGDDTAGTTNRDYLQQLFDAGQIPCLREQSTLYVNGTIKLPRKVGYGRLRTNGSDGYPIDPSSLGQVSSRIVQTGSGELFRVRGAGVFFVEPVELVGDGTSAAIVVEGNDTPTGPATGNHTFANLSFRNWGVGIKTVAGYYNDSEVLQANEVHADNSKIDNCKFFNVGTLFESGNQQSVNWKIRDCMYSTLAGPTDGIICDIKRGGCVTIDGLVVNHPQVTVFKVRDYSPHNIQLICTGLYQDNFNSASQYLHILEYYGTGQTISTLKWSLDFTGFTAADQFNSSDLFVIPGSFPTTNWRYRLLVKDTLVTGP